MGLLLGTAALGVIVPWVVPIIAQFGLILVLEEAMLPVGVLVVTFLATVFAGLAVGWNWRMLALIGGFALYNLVVGTLVAGLVAAAINVGIFSVGYALGGLARLPFRRPEED
jgi:hypothetical protein